MKRRPGGFAITPYGFPLRLQSGVIGRDDLAQSVGPHSLRKCTQTLAAIVSEPSRMHARTAQWTKLTVTEILVWRSPPNGDRMCLSHLSHQFRPNVRGTTLANNSDSQFACPRRGRKHLSREVARRTVLTLEWPELVQIGRCKVCWLPTTANK